MVTAVAQQEREVQCNHQDGSRYTSFRASNRNMHWREICSELIDNANMAGKPGEACNVVLEWGGKRRDSWFSIYDDGVGSADLQPFFSCGVSNGRHVDRGSSTFGMGLFGVECVIDGTMTVATVNGGRLNAARRTVREKESGFTATIEDGDAVVSFGKFRMPYPIGTLLHFHSYSKSQPRRSSIDKLAGELGRSYGGAIAAGNLAIQLRFRGAIIPVQPAADVPMQRLNEESFELDGHTYSVKWGVTQDVNRDNGVRLIYGGKLFDTTRAPCGDYAIDRFFAELVIPRSIGERGMDLFKRGVDDEVLQPVYEKLAVMFDAALVEADALSQHTKYESLNDSIKGFLCGKKPRDAGEKDGVGDKDTRTFNGRDPEGVGVQPVNSGKTRKGKGGAKKKSDSLSIHWAPLGDDKPLCLYEDKTTSLTFNADIRSLTSLRDSQNEMAAFALAAIAAGYMAYRLKSHAGYGDYDWQFKKNIKGWPSSE